MTTRRHRSRAFRPQPEGLESRQLLASAISGVDVDGDTWVLRLIGPGDLQVLQQPGADAQPVPLGQPGLIDSITVAGANPQVTRLVGTVTPGASGDGKVFFQSLQEIGGSAEGSGSGLGLLAVDMPGFWLGQTAATASTTDPVTITIPDGIVTLRFGGADVTYAPPGGTAPNQNTDADTFTINLGLPMTQGTSIIVDQVITDAQAGVPQNNQPATPVQDSVVFTVVGRLNQFQANNILGNADFPPSGFSTGGGTVVQSIPIQSGSIVGQIGFIRVGGNATNFSVQTSTLISNFFIGGETENVNVLAPNGIRNVLFGKGMDDVTIRTHYIDTLQANRGAIGSNVTVDRDIERMTFGGDVVNTTVLSGYAQNLGAIFQSQQLPTTPPTAQAGGVMGSVLIAGDVVDSIFAASVEPFNGQYDVPDALLFPHSHISAKVEGTINNSTAAPSQPGQAFFAKSVKVAHGPVIPPSVPELPFPHPNAPPRGPRIVEGLQPVNRPGQAAAARLAALQAARAARHAAMAHARAGKSGT